MSPKLKLNASADSFASKLVGTTYEDRQQNIQRIVPGQLLQWVHESNNKYDANAVMVYVDRDLEFPLGHLNKKLAKNFVRRMKGGYTQSIRVTSVTGGVYPKRFGVNVLISYWKGGADAV
jgi:single-stranded-DNA-specific exonuclease